MTAVDQIEHLNGFRSEEHTSELQSHLNLVCRLLLEKKNRSSTTSAPRRAAVSGTLRHGTRTPRPTPPTPRTRPPPRPRAASASRTTLPPCRPPTPQTVLAVGRLASSPALMFLFSCQQAHLSAGCVSP